MGDGQHKRRVELPESYKRFNKTVMHASAWRARVQPARRRVTNKTLGDSF